MEEEVLKALRIVLNHSKAYGCNKKYTKIVEAWLEEEEGKNNK